METLEAATRSEKEIPTSMSLDDVERKGITQLEHHMKGTTKSSTSSSTDGAAGINNELVNNREWVQPTKPNKKKGGEPTIRWADGIFSNSTIQNCIRLEDKDSDDEHCNKDEALETTKEGARKR